MSFRVEVADNFHALDPSEHLLQGVYETAEGAISACRSIVDRSLAEHRREGLKADELYLLYQHFGLDPFIVAEPGSEAPEFSAWDYARSRCAEICGC